MKASIDFRDPKVQKIGLVLVLFLGFNYVFFFTDYFPFLYTPKKCVLGERREEYRRLALRVEEAKRAAANLPKLEEELEALHGRWEVAMSRLPEKKEIATLLRRVTLSGERSGVRFLLFEPTEVFAHGVYDEHPVNVKVEGGYHGIGSFLGRLLDLDRIIQVSSISLKSERSEENDPVVRGEMVLSAYTVPLDRVALPEGSTPSAGGAKGTHERTSAPEIHSNE